MAKRKFEYAPFDYVITILINGMCPYCYKVTKPETEQYRCSKLGSRGGGNIGCTCDDFNRCPLVAGVFMREHYE